MFRLALALGKTVRQLSREIDSRELSEWMIFDGIEPFGEQRSDLRAGIIAATVVNSNPYRRKGSKGAEPRDFMPFMNKRAQTAEEQIAICMMFTAQMQAAEKARNGNDRKP